MKERKRRSKKDIQDSIINAATRLIEKKGFSELTVTELVRESDIVPVQFYQRYKDLDEFIDEYVKRYDYWFSDVVKLQTPASEEKEQYSHILNGLFDSLLNNKVMQQLLKWELSCDNDISRRTARLRELHTIPLCQKYDNMFSGTSIDIVAVSALIVGGIYYLILHDNLSSFSGIDLKKEADKTKIINAIYYLSDTFFPSPVPNKEILEVARKMKEKCIDENIIIECTGLSKQQIESLGL